VIVALIFGDGLLNEVYQTVLIHGDSVIKKPYMKGIKSRNGSFYYHQIRGIIEPAMTLISAKITYLLSGIIVVENIFNWQGLGYLLWISIQREGPKDYGVIAGVSVVMICIVIFFSIISDWLRIKLHPEYS